MAARYFLRMIACNSKQANHIFSNIDRHYAPLHYPLHNYSTASSKSKNNSAMVISQQHIIATANFS
jgi:hypothetical protein